MNRACRSERARLLAAEGLRPPLPGLETQAGADAVRALLLAVVAGWTWLAAPGSPAPATAFLPLALCLCTVLAAQAAFALLRRRPMETGGVTTALMLALLMPAGLPPHQVVLAALVGIVLGELIFGGRGFGFLDPAVVGLAFAYFSSPGLGGPANPPAPEAAALAGLVLLGLGLADFRVILAALIAAIALSGQASAGAGSFLLLLAFSAADPATVPLWRLARWALGAGLVALVALLGGAGEARALVFSLLLAGVFAPLLDSAARAAIAGWRRTR